MRKRKQHVSEDNLTVSKLNKRSSNSGGEVGYFDRIHVDLVVNILSKLPTKDIAKCRCVSKLWSSIICIPNYILLFPIKHPVTPKLLFAFEFVGRRLSFYSSLQPPNPVKGNLFWRTIQCGAIHYPLYYNDIWINGVLYYPALLINKGQAIVCFDVKSEKFSFINIDQDMATKISEGTFNFSMIDYKGKLSACYCDIEHALFELWVLEDAEKHKWSKHSYQMQHTSLSATSYVRTAGVIGSGDIVLSPCYARDPFFIFYYILERNVITTVRVEVPVFEMFGDFGVHTFPNYFENVRLM